MAIVSFELPDHMTYVLIPKDIDKVIFQSPRSAWDEAGLTPSIEDVAQYTGLSERKIREELKKKNCPLHVINEGAKGRGKKYIFIRESVEQFKKKLQKW